MSDQTGDGPEEPGLGDQGDQGDQGDPGDPGDQGDQGWASPPPPRQDPGAGDAGEVPPPPSQEGWGTPPPQQPGLPGQPEQPWAQQPPQPPPPQSWPAQQPQQEWAGQQPQYQAAPPTNGLAIASVILSVLWLCWVGSIAGLIMGYMARSQIKESAGRQGGDGVALAGIIIGWIGVASLLLIVLPLFLLGSIGAVVG